ncbi:hypothetical protein [Sphingomonas sp. Y38-1Y]|uniref:hypothetical protein n=1 Tax=Sphingomonas sp. Y38-1Y TaxID=3078265 RepID=UPI0028E4C682|nr:hypothetical protein [Sphingomonas sp. Y38-1Y]
MPVEPPIPEAPEPSTPGQPATPPAEAPPHPGSPAQPGIPGQPTEPPAETPPVGPDIDVPSPQPGGPDIAPGQPVA